MTSYGRLFIKSSLAWLCLGVTAGGAMAIRAEWMVYRPAHFHMLALGFAAMMIYGVAYHVMPRFSGVALASEKTPMVHWWLSNVGLLMLASGFVVRAAGGRYHAAFLATGGVLSALGAYQFAWTIWRTIEPPRVKRVRRSLLVVE